MNALLDLARPRLANGRFVPVECPDCGNGVLRRQGMDWHCDGLIDPGHPDSQLQACERCVVNGVLHHDRRGA